MNDATTFISGRLVGIGGAAFAPRCTWPAPKAEDTGWEASFPFKKHPTTVVYIH